VIQNPGPLRLTNVSTDAHAAPIAAREEIVLYLASFSLVAGIIHLVASVDHFEHVWWYGAFFVLLAAFQLAWGIRVFRRPTPGILLLGAAVSAVVVAIWIVSRTVGVPFGPEAWDPETVGAIDVGATVDELAIIGLVWPSLRGGPTPAFGSAARFAIYAVLTLTALTMFLGASHHS
jgi:hypothetical protein